jgi:hypothetical protein
MARTEISVASSGGIGHRGRSPEMNATETIIQRAYADLAGEVFLRIRNRIFTDAEQLSELGDAMHNIAGVLLDHGTWIEDEKYRELYLRPYDTRWGSRGIALEKYLDERIDLYSRRK